MAKIGPVRLAGLLVAPILGSGIVLLPPIVVSSLGSWSVAAWAATVVFGLGLAVCFTCLGIRVPNAGGIAESATTTLGPTWGRIASYSIVFAAMIGPVVVLRTGAEFIAEELPGGNVHVMTGLMLLVGHVLVLSGLRLFSSLTLLISLAASLVLILGSVFTLTDARIAEELTAPDLPPMQEFAQAFLLLFWAVIGWDIVLHYAADMRGQRRTMIYGIGLGSIVVSIVMLLVASATLVVAQSRTASNLRDEYDATIMLQLFTDIAGPSPTFFSVLVVCLTMSTFLMVVGAVIRLIQWLVAPHKSPVDQSGAQVIFAVAHVTTWIAMWKAGVTISLAVSVANILFIVNIVVGLVACWAQFRELWFRILTGSCIAICIGVSLAAEPSITFVTYAVSGLYIATSRRKALRSNT